MPDHPIHRLDDDVHQRVRLGILAHLSGVTRADFTLLRRELHLTDGNLGRHLETLEAAGLVKLEKGAVEGDRRPRTWVRITRRGRSALHQEIKALRELIALAEPPTADEDERHTTTAPLTRPARRRT
jgi:DNA-binding MarR family transcriptional regulator